MHSWRPGENGKIQAYLDLKNIPYVNSDFHASSLSFDKYTCNQFLKSHGVNTKIHTSNKNQRKKISPMSLIIAFVNPLVRGPVTDFKSLRGNQLDKAIKLAFTEGDELVMESFLKGRELTCAVFRERQLKYELKHLIVIF